MKEPTDEKKIEYTKPEILDLGPVTPTLGGTCAPTGSLNYTGNCSTGNIAAGGPCSTGIAVST